MLSKISKITGKTKTKQFVLLTLLCLTLMVKLFLTIIEVNKNEYNAIFSHKVAALFGVYGLVAILLFVIFYYMYNIKEIGIEKIYFLSVFLFSLAYMLIFTPFSVPDEPVHFMSAYKVSNYFLLNFQQFKTDSIFIRDIDLDFLNRSSHILSAEEYFNKINELSVFANDFSVIESSHNISSSAPGGYLISGLGIAVARIFKFSPILLFYTGRLFNILEYCFLSYFSIKMIPIGKKFVFVLSLLPMTLHLVASYSCDGFIFVISLLFVSLFLKMYYSVERVKIKDFLVFCGLAILLAPAKMVYLPILFLAFLIKSEKLAFANNKTAFLLKIAVVAVGIVSLLCFQIDFLSSDVSSSGQKIIEWANAPGFTVVDILRNPLGSIEFFFRTLQQKGEFYLSGMLGGKLGWFQIEIGMCYYIPFLVIFAFAMLRTEGELFAWDFYKRFYAALLVVASMILIILSMWLAWTPITFNFVEGVQGRYFIPLLPVLFLAARGDGICIKQIAERRLVAFTAFFGIFYTFEIFAKTFI